MSGSKELFEKIVINEIQGKNGAIHAYDDIIWKVRTGYLTLLFGAWAIIFQGLVKNGDSAADGHMVLVAGLVLFSFGFSLGAWFIDRNYLRRKFRVILSLDCLTDELRSCGDDYLKISPDLLKVAGDNGDMEFDSTGYRQAVLVGRSIYLVSLVTLIAAITLVMFC